MRGSWRRLMEYRSLLGGYDAHPHPVLPSCLAFASATQQASTSDNAGPPQQLFASGLAERLQTPVSGSSSSTRFGGLSIAGDAGGDRADLCVRQHAALHASSFRG